MDKALVRANALLAEARSMIEDHQNKQQEILEEKSEKWQESAAGEALQERINDLENISGEISSIEDSINSLTEEK